MELRIVLPAPGAPHAQGALRQQSAPRERRADASNVNVCMVASKIQVSKPESKAPMPCAPRKTGAFNSMEYGGSRPSGRASRREWGEAAVKSDVEFENGGWVTNMTLRITYPNTTSHLKYKQSVPGRK
jgi:hypothetical protein